jgi:hypothetical protein
VWAIESRALVLHINKILGERVGSVRIAGPTKGPTPLAPAKLSSLIRQLEILFVVPGRAFSVMELG